MSDAALSSSGRICPILAASICWSKDPGVGGFRPVLRQGSVQHDELHARTTQFSLLLGDGAHGRAGGETGTTADSVASRIITILMASRESELKC